MLIRVLQLGAEKKPRPATGITYLYFFFFIFTLKTVFFIFATDKIVYRYLDIGCTATERLGIYKKKKKMHYFEPCLHELLTVFACSCPCLSLIIFNIIFESRVQCS